MSFSSFMIINLLCHLCVCIIFKIAWLHVMRESKNLFFISNHGYTSCYSLERHARVTCLLMIILKNYLCLIFICFLLCLFVALSLAAIGLMFAPENFEYYINYLKALELPYVVWMSAKMLLAWPFIYHFCNGIRHLVSVKIRSLCKHL